MLSEVVDSRANSKNNIEYAGDPDKLLGKGTCHGEVEP